MKEKQMKLKKAKQENLKSKSFDGGKPWLTKETEIPKCELCSQCMPFYFQLSLEEDWLRGKTFSLFSSTNCHEDDYVIPKMLTVELKDAVITKDFLTNYQKKFRLFIFNTDKAVLQENYEEKIIYKEMIFVELTKPLKKYHIIGGDPCLILEDESPKEYEGKVIEFFMQLKRFRFSDKKRSTSAKSII